MKLVDDFLKIYTPFQRLYEMGRCGKFAEFSVHVYGGERQIPHFHFVKKQAKKNQPKEGCICLTEAKYYIHSGKTATLNQSERKELMEYLRSIEPSSEVPYYQFLCDKWNENNRDNSDSQKVQTSAVIPDYLNELGKADNVYVEHDF